VTAEISVFFGPTARADYNAGAARRKIMSHGVESEFETGGGTTKDGPQAVATGLVGTTLDGAYAIKRLIAEGGMSAVYEAVQVRLNQRVAVKVMARELASNPEALARFRREAEIASHLRHPHLVTVMDFGTAPDGQPYLVMEHLEGNDLDHRIRKVGRLPLDVVVNITQQVASALGAAHDEGIVHRDLKPANLFLVELPGEPDFAKVLDFGISKIRAATTQLTKASAIIGTPNYMSPEQATGMIDEIDHRTDQWALACIVWEMVSGRPPFASDDVSAVFYQVIHLEPQPLRSRAPELPPAVETVLRKALSKNQTDRFGSVKDFANALAGAATQRPWETRIAHPAAPDAVGASVRPAGRIGVERRQKRQERRRVDNQGEATPSVSLWRRVKPVHALSALSLTLLVAVLLPRWNHSTKAAALPVDTPGASTSVHSRPLAVEAIPVAQPSVHAPPEPAAHESSSTLAKDDTAAPRRRPSKYRLHKATKISAEFVDPFEP